MSKLRAVTFASLLLLVVAVGCSSSLPLEVTTCTTASIEERGECEPLDMIERWTQSVTILVTAPEPIEVTDYYIVLNHPADLSDPWESRDTDQQAIEFGVAWQDGLVQLSATEFYYTVSKFSASGIYGIMAVDQDFVDGNSSAPLGFKNLLVSDGDFDAEYASYECSPGRLILIENPEQYKAETFSFTVTIAVATHGLDLPIYKYDMYIGTLNGDPMQPVEIHVRPYQHRSWNVNDQVRFVAYFMGVRDSLKSYMNPTPFFWSHASGPVTASGWRCS